MLVFIRTIIGVIFLVSGFEKAVSPSANFLYVIQAYQIVPSPLDQVVSRVFPWIELGVGAFVAVGLFLPWALRVSALMSLSLLGIVAQAMLRNLPIDSCGCFGNLVHLPLQGVFILDLVMLASAILLLKQLDKARSFSVDAWYGA
jgi:uncharacterized membrane protein YphA (DoxX/SURF4 family)